MCGIAGAIGFDDIGAAESAVRRMTSALARRGPDGEGVEVWPEAALGHRRLAIFDLSAAGSQPMSSPDRAVSVVFNGAIYNFPQLRAELVTRGFSFRSETDTETLVHGYRAWGIDDLVARLRGMFAFGLWDAEARKLFLVRDRLGVKPLVYAVGREYSIVFASSVRALREAGAVGEIDERAMMEYLEFGFVTDDRAIYRGAVKVPAATIVECAAGRLPVARTYWTPPVVCESKDAPSFAEAVEETERLFLRAVEMRLQADVPVGALLSGGVDSSLVCWAIKRLGGDITAFTVGTPDDAMDETEDARQTAAALGINHQTLALSADDAPDVDELVKAFAEPFACASALGMLGVSRVVKQRATVLLTGDGGDDVFLGYPEHRHLWLAGKLARRMPDQAAGAWLALRESLPTRGALRRLASFLNYASGGLGAVACARDGLPVYEREHLLGERLMNVSIGQRQIPWSHESAGRVLAEFLEYDRRTRFTGEYLPKVDGATMYHGLEARSPFLDQELWEFAAALPFDVRLRRGKLKAVLREVARRRVGERVARGRKRGFGIPVGSWLAGRWRARFDEMMSDSIAARDGWISASSSRALLERVAAGDGRAPNQLWYIFVLESWLRREQEIRPRANEAEMILQSDARRETEAVRG